MITDINPMLLIDAYKADHRRQYPENTQFVYSNLTPRMSRIEGVNEVVFFGLQYFMKEYLIDRWNHGFFNRPKDVVLAEYKRRMDNYLGPDAIPIDHVATLHDIGFLPIRIKALQEGTLVPMGVPMLTIKNTVPEFSWLTNYLETLMSNVLWKPTTSATTAYQYRKEFERHQALTGYDSSFIQWQGHDFSFRGMSGIEDALMSGAGHLLSFTGGDTIPAIDFLERFYGADSDKELVGGSVPATEHSVMSMGDMENEIDTFRRLITKLYPKGVVSIVSDTWDFWKVITEYLPALKEEILARDGRVVIRPDSGDPADIICGTAGKYIDISKYFPEGEVLPEYFEEYLLDEVREDTPHGEHGAEEYTGYYKIIDRYYKATIHNISWNRHDKQFYFIDMWEKAKISVETVELSASEVGAYEMLWDTFDGTVNDKGYKELNPKIGLIYGDSITMDRQKDILARLEAKGFSASNLVLGIGSFTYEYVTRDTFGFAMKATWGQVDYEGKEIFKDPKTDSGFKKSARGLLQVYNDNGTLKLKDQCTNGEEDEGLLKMVFNDGEMIRTQTLSEIRHKIQNQC